MKKGKGYKDSKHSLNCPPNSLHKMGGKGSGGDTVISQSLSKTSVPSTSETRPAGYSSKL